MVLDSVRGIFETSFMIMSNTQSTSLREYTLCFRNPAMETLIFSTQNKKK